MQCLSLSTLQLINQHLGLIKSYLILFPGRQLLPFPKHFKSQPCSTMDLVTSTTFFCYYLYLSKGQEQVSLPYILQTPFENVTVTRAGICPSKHHEDKTQSEYHESVYSRVFVMAHFIFFCSSIATPIPPPLLCITCLIFYLIFFKLFIKSCSLCLF